MTATYPGQLDSSQLLVQIEDPATPGTFAHPCLINTNRSYAKTAAATATVVPRCDDPTQPGKTVRVTTSTDSSISGDGILDAATAKKFNDLVGVKMNIKANVGNVAGALVVTGAYILTSFTLTGGSLGALVTAALKFDQADDPASTAHA